MHPLLFSTFRRLVVRHTAFSICFGGALLGAGVGPGAAGELSSVVVASSAVANQWHVEGRIEAVRSATIAAQVQGRVTAISVEPGQRVKAGAVVARIDARELAGSDAARQAQLAQARAEWERNKRLVAQKFISQSALDQAELAYKAAQASASASGASLSHATVTAPITGVVGERLIEVGEMAAPGRPLLSVFDPTAMRVVASVPVSALTTPVTPAMNLVKDAAVLIGNRRLAVSRVEVLPTIDAGSQTATVRLYLATTEDIKPGTAVGVELAAGSDDGIAVPNSAVARRGEVTAVYVIATDGRPRLRQVRLGDVLGDGRIRIEAGLAPGERVALDPVKAAIAVTAATSAK